MPDVESQLEEMLCQKAEAVSLTPDVKAVERRASLDAPTNKPSQQGRHRTRTLLVAAIAALTIAASGVVYYVGTAADNDTASRSTPEDASGSFSPDETAPASSTPDLREEPELAEDACANGSSLEELVATHESSAAVVGLIAIRAAGDSRVIDFYADQREPGEEINGEEADSRGCLPPAPLSGTDFWVRTTGSHASTNRFLNPGEASLTVFGEAPVAGVSVDVKFEDGTVDEFSVEDNGFFIRAYVRPGVVDGVAKLPATVSVLDVDGNVVASHSFEELNRATEGS